MVWKKLCVLGGSDWIGSMMMLRGMGKKEEKVKGVGNGRNQIFMLWFARSKKYDRMQMARERGTNARVGREGTHNDGLRVRAGPNGKGRYGGSDVPSFPRPYRDYLMFVRGTTHDKRSGRRHRIWQVPQVCQQLGDGRRGKHWQVAIMIRQVEKRSERSKWVIRTHGTFWRDYTQI